MAVDFKTIGARLRRARELQALSPAEVARQSGIPLARLEHIEAGVEKPNGDEVLILAAHYAHDFRDFIDPNRPEPFNQTEILYRRHGSEFTAQDRRAIQEFLYLCEIEAALEVDLNITPTPFSVTPRGGHYKSHGADAADKLRKLLNYKNNEVPSDVYADFRKLGMHIFRRRLSNPDLSGLYIEHPSAGHCILINYDEDIYRQRFSVSHEAAHAVFDSSVAVTVSYKRDSNKYNAKDLQEVRANCFASRYLLPPEVLSKVGNWNVDNAVNLASTLKVSTAALSYALLEEGLINVATSLAIRSKKVPANQKVDPELPTSLTDRQRQRKVSLLERGLSDYYVGLCFEAYQRELISAGRLSEALLADHQETREISVLYGRSINHEQ